MARPGFSSQLGTLLERTVLVYLGSPGTLAIMMAQPPLVGAVLGLGWQNQRATDATYLCMAIAAVYIGAMNSATAIVRERAVFSRERMFCLNIWSYLFSKIVVLAAVCAAQMTLLLVTQAHLMHLPAGAGAHLLMLLSLTLAAVTACGMGLAISAFARTTYTAVLLVPVCIIPQIVFSEVVLGESGIEKRVPSLVEKITVTKWGYQALQVAGEDGAASVYVTSALVLMVLLGALLGLAAFKLKLDEW